MDEKIVKYQQIKSQNTQLLLVSTAKTMFQKHGYDNVGVREIAQAAKVTTGTFYYYFKGKFEILEAIHEHNDTYFNFLLSDEGIKARSSLDKIIIFFSEHLVHQILEDGKDYTIHRMFRMKPGLTQGNKLYEGLIDIVLQALENHEFRSDETPSAIAKYLATIFQGLTYNWAVSNENFDLQKEAHRYIVRAIKCLHCSENCDIDAKITLNNG